MNLSPQTPLPADYAERVYAGVLGKIIGVYLGRPFEQWSHERIERELGEIRHYVHARMGKPLIVADDDITGTFTFVRALADNGCDAARLTSAQIGQAWLNYILPHRSILWWGGIGVSTEHTAWHRLRSGIPAPRSGSRRLNGQTVAEQIGAQIFIDGWGLLCPGDPFAAASLAKRAASVSHDGTAVHGAQMVAAMVALAFERPSIGTLIDRALATIPQRGILARMIEDVRRWHSADRDWRRTLRRIHRTYGYAIFPGGCHIVPNHALVILALLYSDGDFHRAMTIVNTAGYDTDCNSGNVGCILAVRGGLSAFEGGPDWRGPVADRVYLPTADGGGTISDAVREADALVRVAHRLRSRAAAEPKDGARFHFTHPGSTQGFASDPDAAPTLIENTAGQLRLSASNPTAPSDPSRTLTPTFVDHEADAPTAYHIVACPTLFAGHRVKARVGAPPSNRAPALVCLVVRTVDGAGRRHFLRSAVRALAPGKTSLLGWRIPSTAGQPILAVGLEFHSAAPAALVLDWLTWSGAPRTRLLPAGPGEAGIRGWIDACTGYRRQGSTLVLHHEDGLGFFIQGTREWRDYRIESTVRPRLAAIWGLALRWQGLERHLTLRFDGHHGRLVATVNGKVAVVARALLPWAREQARRVRVSVRGSRFTAHVDDRILFTGGQVPASLDSGAAGLVVSCGSLDCAAFRLEDAVSKPRACPGDRLSPLE
jgi:ADP-ribosylglycohydrolase